MFRKAWKGCWMNRGAGSRPSTRQRPNPRFCARSMSLLRRDTRNGTAGFSARGWIARIMKCGPCCASMGLAFRDGAVGVFRRILNLHVSPLILLAFTWILLRTPWWYVWMRSQRFRRWSGLRGCLNFPWQGPDGGQPRYRRHGTSTLFAALNVATGHVKAGHYGRRRRREFLDFMNEIVAEHPDEEIHVIMDNLNTHKPKRDHWIRRHPKVHLHFTPTHASWLNQIEIWFSLLSRYALRGTSFTSVRQLRQAIDDFISVHNEKAAPFEWTKRYVKSVHPKHKYAYVYR